MVPHFGTLFDRWKVTVMEMNPVYIYVQRLELEKRDRSALDL